MSFLFHAHWLQSASGEKSVLVEISTGRRDTSPLMTMRAGEEVVNGIRAETLAMFGEGEITSERSGNESFLRILPARRAALVIA